MITLYIYYSLLGGESLTNDINNFNHFYCAIKDQIKLSNML